jgi:mRNA (guanine-N7-)-methyltransferase
MDPAAHYNARPERGMAARAHDRMIRLRTLNNWIKSTLISDGLRRAAEFAPHVLGGPTVLDIGCGKGGDLLKFAHQRCAAYIGADVADESVRHAVGRYTEHMQRGKVRFPALFLAGDCFAHDLGHDIEWFHTRGNGARQPGAAFWPAAIYDIASIQFVLHYSFGTEARARMMMRNAARQLRPGGTFVGTIPDANLIVRTCRERRSGTIGNDLYKVVFDDEWVPSILEAPGAPPIPPFGVRYNFTLEGAVDDCPEFLVHFGTLVALARDEGLELVYCDNFLDFFGRHRAAEGGAALADRLRLWEGGEFPLNQWEGSGVYLAFMFQKVAGTDANRSARARDPPLPRPMDPSDIVFLGEQR